MSSGCRSAARQARRRRRELQRSPRSPYQEHPSIASENGKLRLLRVRPRPSSPRPPTIRLAPLQHTHEITNAAARLPGLEPRHPQPRPLFRFHHVTRRRAVRPTAPHDGRGSTNQQLHQHARRRNHSHRANDQRARERVRATRSPGLRARVQCAPPPIP